MFALVDPDPSGLDIYRVCKFGAEKSARENVACPWIQLLGVTIEDVEQLGILHHAKVRASLDKRDRAILTRLSAHDDPLIRASAEAMVRLGRKAEIESLDVVRMDYLLEEYIGRKMEQLAAADNDQQEEADPPEDAGAQMPIAAAAGDADDSNGFEDDLQPATNHQPQSAAYEFDGEEKGEPVDFEEDTGGVAPMWIDDEQAIEAAWFEF